jgi:hypothetical protein
LTQIGAAASARPCRLGSRQFGDLANFLSLFFRMDRWRGKASYFIAKSMLLIKIPDDGLDETKMLQIEVPGLSGVVSAWASSAALA